VMSHTAAIFDASGFNAVVAWRYDAEALKQNGRFEKVVGYDHEGASDKIFREVKALNPKKIAVDMSASLGPADGLTSGMRSYLSKSLKEYGRRFVSAEDLVIALRSRLLPDELKLVQESINRCEKIFRSAEQSMLRPGVTDRRVHELMIREVHDMGMETAWPEHACPSVTVGTDPVGHIGYNNTTLEKGSFVRIDFGVAYKGYCSDIQHVYLIGDGKVPPEAKRMFDTARKANDAAIAKIERGVAGHVVDRAARQVVLKAGYPDFPHGTGHPVARLVHDIGPHLAPPWRSLYGTAPFKGLPLDMVFTVEPSVHGPAGMCNLEQDVLVTEKGPKLLHKGQTEITEV